MAQETVILETKKQNELVDVTSQLKKVASKHPEASLMAIYARGATAAVMVQENWDPNITLDILSCLDNMVPSGVWLHDQVDGNASSHIKAGFVGASETIPMNNGELLLSTWQNIFFCEFDGPRRQRELVVTIL